MEQLMVTAELKKFCSALVDLYETIGDTSKNASVDWWYGFSKDIDVNLFVEDGRLSVWAYLYDGNLDTRSGTKVIDRRVRRRKAQ